jgi:hypothetical protein
LAILTGSPPNLQPTELDLIQDLSTPGELCLYHADFAFEEGGSITKDNAIQKPGEVCVESLARSAVVIDVNKIMPDIEEHRHDVAEGGDSNQQRLQKFNTVHRSNL